MGKNKKSSVLQCTYNFWLAIESCITCLTVVTDVIWPTFTYIWGTSTARNSKTIKNRSYDLKFCSRIIVYLLQQIHILVCLQRTMAGLAAIFRGTIFWSGVTKETFYTLFTLTSSCIVLTMLNGNGKWSNLQISAWNNDYFVYIILKDYWLIYDASHYRNFPGWYFFTNSWSEMASQHWIWTRPTIISYAFFASFLSWITLWALSSNAL